MTSSVPSFCVKFLVDTNMLHRKVHQSWHVHSAILAVPVLLFFFVSLLLFQLLDKLWSQVSSLLPPVRAFSFDRAWGSAFPLLVDFHRTLLTHALALSTSQLVHKKKPLPVQIYASMYSGGLELTRLTYSRHEDNLLHHRGDRLWNREQSSLTAPDFYRTVYSYIRTFPVVEYHNRIVLSYEYVCAWCVIHNFTSRKYRHNFLVVKQRNCCDGCNDQPTPMNIA